nr:methyltransferase domain-containing protein [Glycomyces sp. L485]
MAERLYSEEQLAGLPDDAIDWSLGVGNPVAHAALRPGERIVDLGCGGGIDSILAAREVGPTGTVTGVDTLTEMCERTRQAAGTAGVAEWCDAVQGELEDLPLPDDSADAVVSNGVVNLSPRKSRALAEAARVLRGGGRLCIADFVVNDDLPPEVLTSSAAWAGCIAGALSEEVLVKKLMKAGFTEIELGERIPFGIDDVAVYPLFDDAVIQLMKRVVPEPEQRRIATSVIAKAVRAG